MNEWKIPIVIGTTAAIIIAAIVIIALVWYVQANIFPEPLQILP